MGRVWRPWQTGIIPPVQHSRVTQYLVATAMFGAALIMLCIGAYREYTESRSIRLLSFLIAALAAITALFLVSDEDGYRVPVEFDIPAEAPSASTDRAKEVFVWMLKIRCRDRTVFEFPDVWFGALPILRPTSGDTG
jgi:TRAP-type uncharacterized transport system fused permease subunit